MEITRGQERSSRKCSQRKSITPPSEGSSFLGQAADTRPDLLLSSPWLSLTLVCDPGNRFGAALSETVRSYAPQARPHLGTRRVWQILFVSRFAGQGSRHSELLSYVCPRTGRSGFGMPENFSARLMARMPVRKSWMAVELHRLRRQSPERNTVAGDLTPLTCVGRIDRSYGCSAIKRMPLIQIQGYSQVELYVLGAPAPIESSARSSHRGTRSPSPESSAAAPSRGAHRATESP